MKIQHQDKVKGTGSGKIIKSGYTLPFLPFPPLLSSLASPASKRPSENQLGVWGALPIQWDMGRSPGRNLRILVSK